MSCYNPLMRRYTSLRLAIKWNNKWELGGVPTYQASFNGSKTWTYTDFRAGQIENRSGTIPDAAPPTVPCTTGKFTLFQDCCNPYASGKDPEYNRCVNDVFALFDGAANFVIGQPAGVGYLSGTETVYSEGVTTTRQADNRIYAGLNLWPSTVDALSGFTVYLDLDQPVPYEALAPGYLTYPTPSTGNHLISFSSGSAPPIQNGPSQFQFAYVTSTSGPTWTCINNISNLVLNSTGAVTGTYPYSGKVYTADIEVVLQLT